MSFSVLDQFRSKRLVLRYRTLQQSLIDWLPFNALRALRNAIVIDRAHCLQINQVFSGLDILDHLGVIIEIKSPF
jgi:hypothetical protein